MTAIVLIGIGAGVASALLFASPISGTSLAFPLFVITGVPIAIAGLGWTPVAGAIAVVAGCVAVAVAISPIAAAIFLFLFAAPMAWLTYLAGLSRPNGESQEWFPLGRLLLHTSAAAVLGLTIIGIVIGYDPQQIAVDMTDALSEWLAVNPDLQTVPTREEIEPFVRLNVAALPYTLAAIVLVILVVNLWFAGWVTQTSGRLARPHERLWTVSLPASAALAFVLASLVSVLPFPLGDIAALMSGALGGAFLLLGLAVIHALTIGLNGRAALLTVNYVVLGLLGFTAFVIIAVGLAETFLHLRARRFRGAPPP